MVPMSNLTEQRSALGALADLVLPHLMGKPIQAVRGMSELSGAKDFDLDIPELALPLLPFQRAGVAFALKTRRAYIGDEMGLGKTPTAIATLVAAKTFPALVVCPPSLTLNWVREFRRFAPHVRTTRIVGNAPKNGAELEAGFDVYIIGDAVVASWAETLAAFGFSALVVDEAHRGKDRKAKRTQALLTISRKIDRDGLVLLLSGTAVKNRPDELISQVQILGLIDSVFGGVQNYLDEYYPKVGRWERVAQNLDDLHRKMVDTFYVRRLRNDVTELPGKGRSVVSLEYKGDAARQYKQAEANLRAFLTETKGKVAADKAARAEALVLLNTLRRLSGLAKIESSIAYINELVEAGEKVIVFAVHRDVTTTIAKHFNAPTIIGGQSVTETEAAKAAFQDGDAQVIVLNIEAGGVGHTLTASANVVFVELAWTPGDMSQAEDRADRIGQTRKVVSHWIVGANGGPTIDEHLVAILNEKSVNVGAVLDGKGETMVSAESVAAALLEIYSH